MTWPLYLPVTQSPTPSSSFMVFDMAYSSHGPSWFSPLSVCMGCSLHAHAFPLLCPHQLLIAKPSPREQLISFRPSRPPPLRRSQKNERVPALGSSFQRHSFLLARNLWRKPHDISRQSQQKPYQAEVLALKRGLPCKGILAGGLLALILWAGCTGGSTQG